MDYIVGIDQGGTKTLAAVSDLDGNILAVGSAAGGYHSNTGMSNAMEQVLKAADMAIQSVGLSTANLRAVGAGMTGADFPCDYALLKEALQKLFSCNDVSVVNDCMIALRAGTWNRDAAVICAGTGLNCGVRESNGQEFILGYYIDDQWQGGNAIARRALTCVFEADIGMQPETLLTDCVMHYFGVNDVPTLLQRWAQNEIPFPMLRHLAVEVDRLVAEGDAVSTKILLDFGSACAKYVLAGLGRLNLLGKATEVVLSGSIFKSSSTILHDAIAGAVSKDAPLATVCNARYEPVVGGIILALEKLSEKEFTQVTRDTIENSARLCNLIYGGNVYE